MAESTPTRPSQVTLAGWLVVLGSVVVVVLAFVSVSQVGSAATQEELARAVSSELLSPLDLTLSGAQSLLQVVLMVTAATATATAILGWQALQRSKRARLALSVLAVPLFLTGLASGGIAGAVVTAAIVMLWFQPARDWFDGISRPTPPPSAPATPAWPGAPVSPPDGRDPLLDLPPPTQPPLHAAPYATSHAPVAGWAVPTDRPSAVRRACLLTWVASGTTFVVLALTVAAMVADPGILEDARRQNSDLVDAGVSDTLLRNTVYAISGVVMVWAAAAVVLAVLAWRRVRWASFALVASAGLAGGLCLLFLVGSFVLLVPLAACALTVGLLLRPESRAWFRR